MIPPMVFESFPKLSLKLGAQDINTNTNTHVDTHKHKQFCTEMNTQQYEFEEITF